MSGWRWLSILGVLLAAAAVVVALAGGSVAVVVGFVGLGISLILLDRLDTPR